MGKNVSLNRVGGSSTDLPVEQAYAVVYTDGACSCNPGPGGWAFKFYDEEPISGSVPATTNNQMEMYAVLMALEHCPARRELLIITDSRMVVGWLAKNWKANVENVERIRQSIRVTAEAKDITLRFQLVKGHAQNAGNIAVDRAARAQAQAARYS